MSANVLTPYIKLLLLEPPNLAPSDLATVLRLVFRGLASDVQIAAFLTALRMRGLDHRPQYIAAAVGAILEFSHVINPSLVAPEGYVDIVGTGGDGQNTFNVSTLAALVAAGMGLPVCKHGGKAATLLSGSGDLLRCLGIDLMHVTAATVPAIVERLRFCFLFAPAFHPGMARVAAVRAQLGIPLIFNILGPLINPMPLRAKVLGVYSERVGAAYAEATAQLERARRIHHKTLVVWGECGLDEVSPVGHTKIWCVDADGTITTDRVSPHDFGLGEHDLASVRSGTPQQNAEVLLHILRQDDPQYAVGGEGVASHPLVEYILMNTAVLAFAAGSVLTWKAGVAAARELILSGAALAALEGFKEVIAPKEAPAEAPKETPAKALTEALMEAAETQQAPETASK